MHQLLINHQEVFPGEIESIITLAERSPGCDITEHVYTLIEYGKKCKHITEMGVRYGYSTRSFLFAQPKKLISIDFSQWLSLHQAGMIDPLETGTGNIQYTKYKEFYKDVVDFQFILENSTKVDIEPTELLFIDTFHHGDCLTIELNKHGNKASKYIILHDTETFGRNGQDDPSGTFFIKGTTGGPGTGLMDALEQWLSQNPIWYISKHFTNNNGLTILERKS